MGLLQGDIVIVEHTPQNNPTAKKARPALVISSPNFHNKCLDVIILIITSIIRHDDLMEIVVSDSKAYFSQTGLKVTSAIRCGSICSFPKQKVRRKIGVLPQEMIEQAIKRVIGFIDFSK
jgi:mRNA-degrading endonuclease toxin of MazEF toxin-antitoxin module